MLGLTFEKLLLVGLIAAVILGPQRLPVVVARAAALVGSLRRTVDAARVRAADEIGVPADAPQWRALDPRQYDPRRIIAEALAAPPVPAPAPVAPAPVVPAPVAPGSAVTDPVDTTDPDAEDTTPEPVIAPVRVPTRRIRVGTSAHPRWIEVPVDAPSEGDTAILSRDDPTVRLAVTA